MHNPPTPNQITQPRPHFFLFFIEFAKNIPGQPIHRRGGLLPNHGNGGVHSQPHSRSHSSRQHQRQHQQHQQQQILMANDPWGMDQSGMDQGYGYQYDQSNWQGYGYNQQGWQQTQQQWPDQQTWAQPPPPAQAMVAQSSKRASQGSLASAKRSKIDVEKIDDSSGSDVSSVDLDQIELTPGDLSSLSDDMSDICFTRKSAKKSTRKTKKKRLATPERVRFFNFFNF